MKGLFVRPNSPRAVRVYTQCLAIRPENKGIQFGVLCPEGTDSPLMHYIDEGKLPGWNEFKLDILPQLMPTSKVAEASLELLQLECMNGAVLRVAASGTSFHSDLDMVDPGHGAK